MRIVVSTRQPLHAPHCGHYARVDLQLGNNACSCMSMVDMQLGTLDKKTHTHTSCESMVDMQLGTPDEKTHTHTLSMIDMQLGTLDKHTHP